MTRHSIHAPPGLSPRLARTAVPLAIAGLTAALAGMVGCGALAFEDISSDEVSSETFAYKHPPPSTPAPWTYVLTCYADQTTPACGGSKKADGSWWYSTGAYSFGCGSKLQLRANGKCVVVEVVDNGPAGWVETNAKAKCGGTGYVLDTSALVTKALFGESCAGWSDCRQIEVSEVAESTPTGPCSGEGTGSTTPPTQPPPPPAPKICPVLPAAGGVIDEESCAELAGESQYWRSVSGQGDGGSLLWTNAFESATPGNWARWPIALSQAGDYDVEYYAVPEYARFNAVRYVIQHGANQTTKTVDQSQALLGWNKIGRLHFEAGANQHVSIYDNVAGPVAADQHIVVDAIRLTRADAPVPAPAPTPQPPAPQPPPASYPQQPSLPQSQPPGYRPPLPQSGCAVVDGGRADGSMWLPLLVGLSLVFAGARRRGSRRRPRS